MADEDKQWRRKAKTVIMAKNGVSGGGIESQ
jgi:hypothetical protein